MTDDDLTELLSGTVEGVENTDERLYFYFADGRIVMVEFEGGFSVVGQMPLEEMEES